MRVEVQVTLHASDDSSKSGMREHYAGWIFMQVSDLLNLSICPNECLEEAAGPSSKNGFAASCQAHAARGVIHPYRYKVCTRSCSSNMCTCMCIVMSSCLLSKFVRE